MTIFNRKLFIKLVYLVGKVIGQNNTHDVVVCYHGIGNKNNKYSVSLKRFRDDIDKFERNYRFVGLDEILAPNKNGDNRIALTFDDGYKGILKISTMLKEKSIPVTLFLMSNLDKVPSNNLENSDVLLNFSEIKQLIKDGWSLGSHGKLHLKNTDIPKKQQMNEIKKSKKEIEEMFGVRVSYYAYPFGLNTHYSQKIVKNSGYKAAFTTNPGQLDSTTNKMSIPRFVMEKGEIFSIPESFSPFVQVARNLIYKYEN